MLRSPPLDHQIPRNHPLWAATLRKVLAVPLVIALFICLDFKRKVFYGEDGIRMISTNSLDQQIICFQYTDRIIKEKKNVAYHTFPLFACSYACMNIHQLMLCIPVYYKNNPVYIYIYTLPISVLVRYMHSERRSWNLPGRLHPGIGAILWTGSARPS